MDTAALRVFSNADGAYGANVNQLIDSGMPGRTRTSWPTPTPSASASPTAAPAPRAPGRILLQRARRVDLAYQNLESVELGVTTIDHYFDTLGGIGRAVRRARRQARRSISATRPAAKARCARCPSRSRWRPAPEPLNPKWYEGMLRHGYEGVRQIEAQITNTMGWSATTGAGPPWVYEKLTETFVLDDEMRERLARSIRRPRPAWSTGCWRPTSGSTGRPTSMLDALRQRQRGLEDRLEGVTEGRGGLDRHRQGREFP